jgi:hypothetical protein
MLVYVSKTATATLVHVMVGCRVLGMAVFPSELPSRR